jgi:hypothetical protein
MMMRSRKHRRKDYRRSKVIGLRGRETEGAVREKVLKMTNLLVIQKSLPREAIVQKLIILVEMINLEKIKKDLGEKNHLGKRNHLEEMNHPERRRDPEKRSHLERRSHPERKRHLEERSNPGERKHQEKMSP